MGGTVIPPNATDAGQILGEALNGLLGSLGTDGLAGAVAQIHRQAPLDESLTDLRLAWERIVRDHQLDVPQLLWAAREIERLSKVEHNAYTEATNCPICAMVATDRDDALGELAEARTELVIDQMAQLTEAVDALRADLAPVLALVRQVVAIPKVAKALRG